MSHPIDIGTRTPIEPTESDGTDPVELCQAVANKVIHVAGLTLRNTSTTTAFLVSIMSGSTVIREIPLSAATATAVSAALLDGRNCRLETQPGEALSFKLDAGADDVVVSGEVVQK